MKYKFGSSKPFCIDCFWYEKNEDKQNDKRHRDGWCRNEYCRTHGVNDRKLDKPRDVAVDWNESCRQWEDAEDRLTRYEAWTCTVEEWRKGLDRERVEAILMEAKR